MSQPRPKPWEMDKGAGVNVGQLDGTTLSMEPPSQQPVLPPKPDHLQQSSSTSATGLNDNDNINAGSTSPFGGYGSYSNPYSSYGSYGSYGGGMGMGMGMGSYGSYGSYGGMSRYGMGGYGMGMGGVGSGIPGMGGLSDSTNQALSLLESLLLTFSSLTTLLESTYYATNNAVISIGGVMGQIGAVSGVVGGVGALVRDMGGEMTGLIKSVLRIIAKLIIKMLKLIGVEGLGGDPIRNISKLGWFKSHLIKMLNYLGVEDTYGDKSHGLVEEFTKWKRTNDGGKRNVKGKGKIWPLLMLISAIFSVPILMRRIAEYHERNNMHQLENNNLDNSQYQSRGLITESSRHAQSNSSIDPRNLTFAKARYAFKPEDPSTNSNELELTQGDLVAVLNEEGDWWYCRSRDGRIGYVPRTWLTVVKQGTNNTSTATNANKNEEIVEPVEASAPVTKEPVKTKVT